MGWTQAGRGAQWLLLIVLLGLSCVIGSASSVLAVVLALVLAPHAWRAGGWAQIRREPAMLVFLGVFAVLLVVFAVRARAPADVGFALNFFALLLAPVLYVVAREWPPRQIALAVTSLSLAGSAAALVMALVSVFALHWDRAAGFGGGSNLMPRVALVLGFIALAGVFVTRSHWRHLFYFGPVMAMVATYYSLSRGAALAIPLLLVVAVVFLLRDRQTRREFWEPVLLAVVVAGIVALVPLGHVDRFADAARIVASTVVSNGAGSASEKPVASGMVDEATAIRLDMYRTGFEAFRQAPILGNGWANLGNEAARINPDMFAAEAGTNFMFHNDIVNFAVAAGIVGLLCLAALLAAPTLTVLAGRRDALFSVRLYACLQLGGAYAVFGLTDSTFGFDLPTTLYVFLAALILGGLRDAESIAEAPAAPLAKSGDPASLSAA